MTKAQKIAASFDRARRYCPKPEAAPKPDAWMALVLQGMSAEELRREIAQPKGKSADELRWLQSELSKR